MATSIARPERTITVAVAACGRHATLARCLEALASAARLPDELIVVDQAPSAKARATVEQCGVAGARYLEQGRLGLSASRNLALAAASGEVLAVTDDDCVPDPGWIAAVAHAFARNPVPDAVTGPILALGSRPPGAHAVALRAAFAPVDHRGRMPPWAAGSGANFGASREALLRHGGWDERLGAGSPGRAGEDAELLYRILRDGGVVRYEPAAVVRHEWQSWDRRLQTRWSYGYGIGALCGLWLREGDRFPLRMAARYLNDHARQLAIALVRRDRRKTREHALALGGVAPGLRYGLRAARIPRTRPGPAGRIRSAGDGVGSSVSDPRNT
jgi:GT2 family glycosyltransferase